MNRDHPRCEPDLFTFCPPSPGGSKPCWRAPGQALKSLRSDCAPSPTHGSCTALPFGFAQARRESSKPASGFDGGTDEPVRHVAAQGHVVEFGPPRRVRSHPDSRAPSSHRCPPTASPDQRHSRASGSDGPHGAGRNAPNVTPAQAGNHCSSGTLRRVDMPADRGCPHREVRHPSGLSAATFTTDLHAHAASACHIRTPHPPPRTPPPRHDAPRSGKCRCPVEVGGVQLRGGMVSQKYRENY